MSELQMQAECFQWAWLELPETRRLLWAVPNGGTRDGFEATQLKASGALAGVHDLHFFWKGNFYTFELKIGNNQLTEDRVTKRGKVFGQKEFGQKIIEHGGLSFEIRSAMEFKLVMCYIVKEANVIERIKNCFTVFINNFIS